MGRVLPITLTAALFAATTIAAEPLTLRQAMEQARGHAHEVTAAKARVGAAEAGVRRAKGFRLPSVDLSETYVRTDSPAEAFAFRLNQERLSFADFVAGDPNNPPLLDTAMTRFEVTLPIYTGGELGGRIGQATHAAEAARDELAWTGDQAALAAAEAYVSLAQAEEYVMLIERARDTVKAHVDMARAYVEQGMVVESELLRAEVELAHVEDLVLEAKGNARVAAANLAFRLGAPQSSTFELGPLATPAMPDRDLAAFIADAANRKDLEAARSKLRAGELEEQVRRAAFLPMVGVIARGDLYDDTLFGDHGSSTTLMAVAKVNLFHGGSDRAALAAARYEVEAGQKDLQQFEEGIQLAVRKAYEDAVTAIARHETAAKAVGTARETQRITQERFSSGVVKMIDLLDASTALREAETRELVSRAGATAALLHLATQSGGRPESVLP
jgi:outer membrane protein